MKRILILTVLILASCAPVIGNENPPPAQPTTASSPTDIASASAEPADASNIDILANLHAPACDTGTTPADQEGPYYKPGSPERSSLIEDGMQGKKLILAGFVVSKDCFPIPKAWLDFWQADANGNYDNEGYTLRGHQYADNKGRYYLETVLPGKYPERPIEHIHVKVQAPGGEILTTQLYFPTQPVEYLTVQLEDKGDYYLGIYNFILP